MSPAEHLAMYASETKAIIYVLVIIIIVLGSVLLNVWMLYVLQRMKIRGWRKHEKHLATELAARAAEIVMLRENLDGVEVLKAEIRKLDRIRDKSFERLKDQNMKIENLELDTSILKNEKAAALQENEALHQIIEHYRERMTAPSSQEAPTA